MGVGGSAFCFVFFWIFWLHMDIDGYDGLLYFSGFPFRNLWR